MSDSHPTLDQRRAQHAWQAVEQARSLKDDKARKDFAREAKRLPVRIKTAGLGQALAFLAAKSKSDRDDEDYRSRLLKELGDWLLKERHLARWPEEANDNNAVICVIIAGNADLLRRATEEALLYLQWLTRFSEAEFKPYEDGDNDHS